MARRHRTARRMVAAGEALGLYLTGFVFGGGLVAAADLIARSIG